MKKKNYTHTFRHTKARLDWTRTVEDGLDPKIQTEGRKAQLQIDGVSQTLLSLL